MGCGTSSLADPGTIAANTTTTKGDDRRKAVLAAHLSAILGIEPESADVTRYVSLLRADGCDAPEDLEVFSIDDLKEAPFNFKRVHLLKVEKSRRDAGKGNADEANDADSRGKSPSIRGHCSLCDEDVLDTQPRWKNPDTGLYQHQACWNAAEAARVASTSKPHAEATPPQPTQAAAAVVEDAQAEATAIMEAAKATLAAATRQAQETVAQAQADAAQIKEAAAAAEAEAARAAATRQAQEAAAQTRAEAAQLNKAAVAAQAEALALHPTVKAAGGENAADSNEAASVAVPAPVSVSATTNPSEPPSKGSNKPLLPAALKTVPLLPDGKHAFLSYQWDIQEQVKTIKELLNTRNVKCWMDIDGGMKADIYDSMAGGVQGAACLLCFMTQAYQDSANCKLELKFAQQSGVPIIPVMMQANFKASGWLAILTAGSIWTPMYEKASVLDGVDKLIVQAQHVVPGMRGADDGSDAASEASDSVGTFDVAAWGEEMFSLDEVREELNRLREESGSVSGARLDGNESSLCPLPAIVPTLPHGLFVTVDMQSVLDEVLSDESMPQIGFCGMGGIGKTTVSCWVTRDDAVRTKFGMVAWITLGQTPALDSCIDLLHQQLTGSSLPDGISSDQKHEFLQRAFLKKSVLLVLDDCWDVEVAKEFSWIDGNTNSKVLISSRSRDVLNGGEIIDVAVPHKGDAVKMLLSTAGIDTDALNGHAEAMHIVELCKRLPLTIGVSGKLIRQVAQGSSMSARDWADVVALLEEELNDPDGSLSIEEGVIRASIKAIPKKLQRQVTQLFYGFALVPEDTLVPLQVLELVFHACGHSDGTESTTAVQKPTSRLQIRRYLKLLINRSLVLGTVDRPQLHDVMLDYVQKQLSGERYKIAQRNLVEALRGSDRTSASDVGKYLQHSVRHHIKESHDATWESSKQAISWIEDHNSGQQDVVATSAAYILPVETLAKDAEAAGAWWKAALRWNALGLRNTAEGGNHAGGEKYFKLAINASGKAVAVKFKRKGEKKKKVAWGIQRRNAPVGDSSKALLRALMALIHPDIRASWLG